MKITFRIGGEQGSEQRKERRSEQSPPQWSFSVDTTGLIWTCSCRSLDSSRTPPTENCADHSLRRGAACCARCSAFDQRRSSAGTRSILPIASSPQFQAPPGQRTALTENSREIRNFPAFLPGSGQKVEVIENKRLNPFYPGPQPHNVTLHLCAIFVRILRPPSLIETGRQRLGGRSNHEISHPGAHAL